MHIKFEWKDEYSGLPQNLPLAPAIDWTYFLNLLDRALNACLRPFFSAAFNIVVIAQNIKIECVSSSYMYVLSEFWASLAKANIQKTLLKINYAPYLSASVLEI